MTATDAEQAPAPFCATEAQVAACDALDEGAPCDAGRGWCHDSVCLQRDCGDGWKDPGEACDDGNTRTGDGCAGDCSSNETCGNGRVDPVRVGSTGANPNEDCDDGNLRSHDGCSSTCARELPQWTQLQPMPPSPHWGTSLVYDAAYARIVMFGGVAPINGEKVSSDATYEWTGAGWSRVTTQLAPPPRSFAGLTYDPVHRRVIMFGGDAGGEAPFNDVWELDGAKWTPRVAATSPLGRIRFGFAYDGRRKVAVMFGGFRDKDPVNGGRLADTWEWDGTTWTQVTTATSPPPRSAHALVYDPVRGVMVMWGGQDETTVLDDTWEYDGTDWRRITSATMPVALHGVAATYDPAHHRILSNGGTDASGNPVTTTYFYDGTSWQSASRPVSPARDAAGLVADPRDGTVVMFGGRTAPNNASGETWQWNGASWSQAHQLLPSARVNASAAYDPMAGLAWMFGGRLDGGTFTNELWSFDGHVWTRNATSGPAARRSGALAYDQLHRQLVLFGGELDGGGIAGDTWTWNGTAWSSVAPPLTPPPRTAAAMATDVLPGRLVMHGGG
ncbi:MAG: hypothetical protein SFX73_38450, partial [Kofleriaceae bacterium]|nr:hypothetical protein [Kofleriaceae bacterium]